MSKPLNGARMYRVVVLALLIAGCDSKPSDWNMRSDLERGRWRYNPERFLMLLKRESWFAGSEGPWELTIYAPLNGVTNWIGVEDVKVLSKYKEDRRPCAGVTTGITSPFRIRRYSTVQTEAAYIIIGYFDGGFPPPIRSSWLSEDQIELAFKQAEAIAK